MVKRMIKKIEFDDETLAWQALLNTEPGSQFLTHEHTFRHCRDGLMPINFIRMTREGWRAKVEKDLFERVTAYCKDILENSEPPALSETMVKEMDSLVTQADANLR